MSIIDDSHHSIVKMNDTISFAKKTSQSTITGTLAEIAHENEVNVRLTDIIETIKNDRILHLKETSKNFKTICTVGRGSRFTLWLPSAEHA